MTTHLASLERRIALLETSARRWRASAIAVSAVGVMLAAAAFRQPQVSQTLETERITLRQSHAGNGIVPGFSSRAELSLGRGGGLRIQFFNDSAGSTRRVVPELSLLNADGQEVTRLGGAIFRPLSN
jgi:hypothetical protein